MKVISLNTWGGRGGLPALMEFFKNNTDIDIFCLQEVWSGGEEMVGRIGGGTELIGVSTKLLSEIQEMLPDHSMYFRPHVKDYYGLAMFVKKSLEVTEEGEIFVYNEKGYMEEDDIGNHARNIQYVRINTADGLKTVINFHGLWTGNGKDDTPDRLQQSDNIISFLKGVSHPIILCGDFNLLPNTESIKKLEQFSLRNLITEYGITSTRTSMYTKDVKFADYIFISKDVTVNDFKVLPEEVSDHAPLYLEFE